nr:MAG TPA: hypothetical protein [Bacteriophage sp.]
MGNDFPGVIHGLATIGGFRAKPGDFCSDFRHETARLSACAQPLDSPPAFCPPRSGREKQGGHAPPKHTTPKRRAQRVALAVVSQYRQTPKARKTPLKRLCGQGHKITAPE